MALSFEIGNVRPSNENNSLVIRVTRNSPKNNCRYCIASNYKPFEIRDIRDIKNDIASAKQLRDKILEIKLKADRVDGGMQKIIGLLTKDPPNESFRNVALWILGGGENVFLQDDNCLALDSDSLGGVITYLKEIFPKVKRVTITANAQTAVKKKSRELSNLRLAGLSRVHIGLDSGYDPVLDYMNHGETASQHIKAGQKIVSAGISLTEYVILGLGGKKMSVHHAKFTAKALSDIGPEFIRTRTLIANNKVPLWSEIVSGGFVRATDEELVREQRILIDNLNVKSLYVSDHISNLLPELEGKLPNDKPRLISILNKFEALTPHDKANFMIGRRVGLYKKIQDIEDSQRHELVEQIKFKLMKGVNKFDPTVLFGLMEEFI